MKPAVYLKNLYRRMAYSFRTMIEGEPVLRRQVKHHPSRMIKAILGTDSGYMFTDKPTKMRLGRMRIPGAYVEYFYQPK